MASSDALVVVEDWISEHYFTAESRNESFQAHILARRKEWETTDGDSTRSRFTAARGRLESDLAALYDDQPDSTDLAGLYERVQTVLGYRTGEFTVRTAGPVQFFATPGVAAEPFALVSARPIATIDEIGQRSADTLTEPYLTDDDAPITSAARLLSLLFVTADGPAYALVQAGRWLIIADRERWPEGRYLGVDLQLVAERNDTKRGGEIDKALTCVAAASLAPDAEGQVWWSAIVAESVKHTVGVSKDLREGVRRSIEIIANEVVARRATQGRPPLAPDQAQPLAIQSLRFLYRILFLLYAEASPELGVLPAKAPEYSQGYSLDRLRELVTVELATDRVRAGTHFYGSLHRLFLLVDQGHQAPAATRGDDEQSDTTEPPGLEFNSLRADLFRPTATALIDEVGLGNAALQDVLQRLLLSRQAAGQDRGFISYVDLGINQLGAVYEGLMSYTGFFATEDLYEVAKGGNSEKGSWVVPVTRAEGISPSDFVTDLDPETGERRPVLHHGGSFVFRLSGRERQRSASFYTPEVLTRFTVGQALAELLDQDGATTTAEEILGLSICEPALGSGAFAIEAVRQLAEQYLERRQAERGEMVPPDEYPGELQRVKAYIALHQVYGVDLNATAVELAEISLWLDTMAAGLAAPWFGLRLRRGNSLIGARHAVYSRAQVNDKTWLVAPPTDVPMSELASAIDQDTPVSGVEGRIHHFLLPAAGWGATSEAKEARELSPGVTETVRQWRKGIKAKPTRAQLDLLVEVSRRVETLWQIAYRRLRIAEAESHRDIPVWGRTVTPHGSTVGRDQIEDSLADANGAYQRLRLIMDAWCALWFWPLHGPQADPEARIAPPTLDQWTEALQSVVGRDPQRLRKAGMHTLAAASDWTSLGEAEQADLDFAQAQPIERVLADHPWLRIVREVSAQQGFFHWELDFATIFARGGFDLQVGNPPWVRPRTDVDALLAEGDPWWQLALKPSETLRADMRARTLRITGIADLVVSGTTEVVATAVYVGAASNFPELAGLQPDLYRCFMSSVWHHSQSHGASVLIHYETHFTDERAGLFRRECYRRLRRHWEFINELLLFDIEDHKHWGLSVFGAPREPRFLQATSLYHPDTVTQSMNHDGSGPEPGFKDPQGRWDLRPHSGRITTVTLDVLSVWHQVLEHGTSPVENTRMLYAVNSAVAHVLTKMAMATRLGSLGLHHSAGWHEKNDRTRGRFIQEWGEPASWSDAIVQGPHLHVNNPFYKSPNKTMLHNQDWSSTDLEHLAADVVPVTAYKPAGDRAKYDAAYTHWGDQGEVAARDHYRVAWRAMAANTGERTLMSALVPPAAAHVHAVASSAVTSDVRRTVEVAAICSSLIADFLVRAVPKSTISGATVGRFPTVSPKHPLYTSLLLRTLRLNCLTGEYSRVWRGCWTPAFASDRWTVETPTGLAVDTAQWSEKVPLRFAADRRRAQIEIDTLVALMLSITPNELCTVYRTQFAVLYGYDHWDYTFDANGRLVPNRVLSVWRNRGDAITAEERTDTNQAGYTYTYDLPFRTYDREVDMRQAYAEFERRLAERS